MHRNWRELIKPKKIEWDPEKLTDVYGKLACEPLERGFGHTLGNALRRVLLSSLQGAAVTAVKIEGVRHEFSTLPGVREDVTDILLNLKGIRLNLHSGESATARIKATGEQSITVTDIEAGHSDGRFTEVLSGLKAGDKVLLHPPDTVKDGTAVTERGSD